LEGFSNRRGSPVTSPKYGRQPTIGEATLSWSLRHLPIKHGVHRLLDRICQKSWSSEGIVACDFHGKTLAIDISDLVGWHFLMLRGFHPEVIETIVRFADKNAEEVFWDIGANKGACSYQVAHALPKCKIVAVEPQMDLIPNLSENLQVVAEGRADVFPVGIGEKSEISYLYVPKDNKGAASLLPPLEFPLEKNGLEVRVVTAEWVERNSRFGWPTLVKIDVEGFEPKVIKSLLPALESGLIKCCVFECKVSEIDGFQQIHESVEGFGYKTYAIRKSISSTWLEETSKLVNGATDYTLVRGAIALEARLAL
jgi:FkbM family methyltransferase